jgi:signal transduction histidine kinase
MLLEILLGVAVLAVAFLIVGDMSKTKAEGLQGSADASYDAGTSYEARTSYDARSRFAGGTRDGRPEALIREPAGPGIPAAAHDAAPTWRPESTGSSADGPQRPGPAEPPRSRRELKNWHVRSRLLLLVSIPAVAVAAAAFCVVNLDHALQGAQIHSPASSVRTGAVVSAIMFGIAIVVIVALAAWFVIIAARSVLRPLYRLRVGALEMARSRRLDAARPVSENNGDGGSADVAPIDMDSADELGEIARAFDQVRREMLLLTANEASLGGKLNAMFVNLSHRSQSLVERQIRLIEGLEQGEQDPERLADLFKVDRIAARMQRSSRNLLVLAGHDLSTGWNQPVALVNVIRAAASELEEHERVSVTAPPEIAVSGSAVNDVVHLFTELAENAASFSAADMPVDISSRQLTTGGVLVDITDRGVGMAQKDMAYANWRLENPPAADINIPKWIGLFVVARLAARHGIRVRLHPAEFGGLTALVWMPDEIITHQSAAPPRLSGVGSVGSRRGEHEAAVEPRRASVGQRTVMAGRRPGPAWSSDSGRQPAFSAEPPAQVRSAGFGQPDPLGEHARRSGQGTLAPGDEPEPSWSAPGASQTSPFVGAPMATAAPVSQAASSSDVGVVIPPAADLADAGRLPIFAAVESHWFRGGRATPGSSGPTAAAGSRWSSPADEGWQAAEMVGAPSSRGSTSAGLPKRQPSANLVPGTVPSAQPAAPPNRSAAETRKRLAGLQRGVSEGRAAAASGEAANSGGEDES